MRPGHALCPRPGRKTCALAMPSAPDQKLNRAGKFRKYSTTCIGACAMVLFRPYPYNKACWPTFVNRPIYIYLIYDSKNIFSLTQVNPETFVFPETCAFRNEVTRKLTDSIYVHCAKNLPPVCSVQCVVFIVKCVVFSV